MSISFKPADPVSRDPVSRLGFVAEVTGIDLTRELSPAGVDAVHEGMERFGVLVFRDQKLSDEQQLVFSRQLGPLEEATGDIAAPQDRRVGRAKATLAPSGGGRPVRGPRPWPVAVAGPMPQRFADELQVTFPVALDGDGEAARRFRVRGLPVTFLPDRDGRILWRSIGPRDWDGPDGLGYLDALLGTPRPSSR